MPIRRNKSSGVYKETNIGPYWPWVRAQVLEDVLRAQKIIQEKEPDQRLITYQEMVAIQVIWHRDFIFDKNVSAIYSKVYDKKVDFAGANILKEKKLLKKVCKNNEEFELINNLLKAQKNKVLLVRKTGLQKDIENLIDEYIDPTFTDVYKDDRAK